MAVLTDPERLAIWAELMRLTENISATGALTKADLRAAVNAIDDWNEANQVAFNTAIPQPARALLSARQKAAIQLAVVARRWLVS